MYKPLEGLLYQQGPNNYAKLFAKPRLTSHLKLQRAEGAGVFFRTQSRSWARNTAIEFLIVRVDGA